MAFTAPRGLKDPVRWRFSAFRKARAPMRSPSERLVSRGVLAMCVATTARARSTSARETVNAPIICPSRGHGWISDRDYDSRPMRRVWNFVIDLADGILGALLYGNQGAFGITSTGTEAQNADKMRSWAANGTNSGTRDGPTAVDSPEDFDARLRRFRRATKHTPEP